MGNPLFKKKPMDWLLNEAKATGEHTLKRTLGPVSLTALGVGAIIGAGIFVLSGLGAHYAGPGLMLSFVISGLGCAFAGLCYAEFAALIPLAGSAYTYAYAALGELIAWIIGWDLTLEYAMGASTVSSGWSNHFIEFLQIFHLKMPLWLAYDHWTALVTAENIVARQMAHVSDPSLAEGSQAFLMRVGDIITAQSPELLQRAHDMVAAPTLFGVEIGFNLPAFLIALVITAILVIGIKESANFNATIVIVKVAVVLFVILLGMHYVSSSNWGHDWGSFAPMGFSGIGRGAAYIFFAYIGFDAVSTTAQEAKNPQRDLPIGIIASLILCTDSLHSGRRGAHRHGAVEGNQYRSAAIGRVSRSRLGQGLLSDYRRSLGGTYQRDAGHAARSDPRAVFHGQRRSAAPEILRRDSSEISHALQEYDSGRRHRGGHRQHHSD